LIIFRNLSKLLIAIVSASKRAKECGNYSRAGVSRY